MAAKKTEKNEAAWTEELPPMYLERRKGKWWKTLLWILLVLAVLSAAAVAVWCNNEFTVALTLQGDAEITLEYGEEFIDPGAQAQFSGTLLQPEPLEATVTTEGAVDTAHLGTYTLTYKGQYVLDFYIGKLTFTDTATRIVRVVDTEAPQLVLITKPDHFTLPGQIYEEEGFTAIDNHDGDITHLVERIENVGTVLYKVTDSSGNSNQILRKIFYNDPVPPELTLQGDAHVTILQGSYYTEPGFTAADNCDGDITDRVTVTGFVDAAVAGTYTLEYSVTDSYSNTVTATRTVTVTEIPPMPQLPPADSLPTVTPNGKVIYLTFDDGPSRHTERLLDILDKYNVKATFFVVKTGYLHLLPRMASSGHTVAIHSATHEYSRIYSSESAYFSDLQIMQNIIRDYTGQTATLLRFPGGSSNSVSRFNPGIMTRLTAMVRQMGYRYFDWNVDSRDASNANNANAVYYNVVNGVGSKSVSVVLQHDTKGFSVEAVDMIIRWGLSNGYTFLPLDATSPVCEHTVRN